MSDKVTINGMLNSKPASLSLSETLGRMVVEMQEYDAKIRKMAQQVTFPDLSSKIETDAAHKALLNYRPEPIIPKGYFEKTQEYQKKSLEVLQSINENTANLYTMVELISQSNENQDELIALMTEILSLAKAKSKDEADSLFKKIMGKINDVTDSVESMIKIAGWATTVYNMVLPFFTHNGGNLNG